ncbi:MAG: hypothetical protein BroJett026_08390 [Betaproteobacteria bacterium]|nr:MAG: hypothetical protein BroJett026_08390 [Betaproteobacteria bacterium]
MVSVFITVDTEVWPSVEGWPHRPLDERHDAARAIDWYLWGGRGVQALGVPWQLDVLARHRLRATYFVDPMFSFALGLRPLRELVGRVVDAGQEVGLHLHPEWLTDPRCTGLPAFAGPLLHRYPEHEQAALVAAGLARLADAGAPRAAAFRAGSWGASRATLRALRGHGIRCDSSLNARFRASFPDLDDEARERATQPFAIEGVREFPVTNFIDRPPRGRRPLHVCAASLGEFRAVLEHAAREDWEAVVIVLHSFEFVRVDRIGGAGDAKPQRTIATRFERLCAYLDAHRERFATRHFADVATPDEGAATHPPLPRSTHARTALRHLQQLASRFY